MEIGAKIKELRLERGLTQEELGDRCELTKGYISQLENDLASPSVGTLEYLASVLGVQAAWLLADEKEEEAAGRTERLRACYRGGDWAGCLELAQDLQPDDEQALLLALAAAQCALHALEAERFAAAQELAERYGCVAVLKGSGTLIAAPGCEMLHNPTGNPGLARGGSGDVLAGMLAALLAQGLAPFDAAACAVWLHGAAADRCAARTSQLTMLPHDILTDLADVVKELTGR